MNDWLEFLGWFIAEGHTVLQKWTNKDGVTNQEVTTTVITQKQGHYTDEIEKCVQRMKIPYTRRNTGVWINSVALTHYLNSEVGKGFNGKRVPSYIFELPPSQIRIFLNAAVKGDGYKRSSRRILYTSSYELAEDYNRLALLSGVNSTITTRPLEGKENKIENHIATSSCDGYVVSITDKNTYIDCGKAKPNIMNYVGKVYCATISGGVLYTRRNGQTLWSGNSAVPDKIYEVAEGGLTDGEPMMFLFGNPTRNTGAFRNCFRNPEKWNCRTIDSREVIRTNKKLLNEWIEEYGDDSDFVRVRIKGLFPKASDDQYFPEDEIEKAMKRHSVFMDNDALVCGIDLSRGGSDSTYISFRKGLDAKSFKTYKISGEQTRDSMRVVSKLTELFNTMKPDAILVDSGSMGGPICDRLRQLNYPVFDVGFGENADDTKKFKNRTAEMAHRFREWIRSGGCIPDNELLKTELCDRTYSHNDKDQLVIERKKDFKLRLGHSPDWGDSLYLTFAMRVNKLAEPRPLSIGQKSKDYNPLENV